MKGDKLKLVRLRELYDLLFDPAHMQACFLDVRISTFPRAYPRFGLPPCLWPIGQQGLNPRNCTDIGFEEKNKILEVGRLWLR